MAQTEFKLKIPPEEVRDLLAPHLEEDTGIVSLFIEKDWKTKFWGEVDDHYFSMRRKISNRGYSNSYRPELGGSIRKTEYGSIVKIWFSVDEKVACLDKITDYMLYGFSLLMGVALVCMLIGGIKSLIVEPSSVWDKFNGNFVLSIAILAGMWSGRYVIRRLGKESAEEDENMMTEFLKNLFSEVEINSAE